MADKKEHVMNRLKLVDPATATGETKVQLDAVKAAFGAVPNMMRAMANSPVVVEGLMGLWGALAKGKLDGKAREAIAIAVAQANSCGYCLAAHTAIGRKSGFTPEQTSVLRTGLVGDPRLDALVTLARQLVAGNGHVNDAQLAAARSAGLGDGEIAEVVANVAVNYFTNYFNHVADPALDFPAVK
jgi:uncharacterized peroxidase-related enzyme